MLHQATELLEGVIANGTKDWPPSVPEIHAVQYYGVNLLTKILSGKHEEVGQFNIRKENVMVLENGGLGVASLGENWHES